MNDGHAVTTSSPGSSVATERWPISASAPAPVATPPGRAEVYERIAALTDCAALQREFDQAETNGRAARARGDLDLSRISTSYMEAADKRMREAGCYR